MNPKFFIFVSGEKKPDFVSRRIMQRFDCDYSHIGMIVRFRTGRTTIYHSVGKGFSKIDNIDTYDEMKAFFMDHNVNEIDVSDHIISPDYALGYLNGRLGVEYSLMQYLGFVWPGLQRFVRNGKEKGICSEEAARFLYHCCNHKVKVNPKIFDFVSPRDVWEKLRSIKSG